MKKIFYLFCLLSVSLYGQNDNKSFSYDFFRDSTNQLFLQETVVNANGTRNINQIPIPDSTHLANNLYSSVRNKFDNLNGIMVDYLRLNKSFGEDFRNIILYQKLTGNQLNKSVIESAPDSLFGRYEFIDTSKQVENFRFVITKESDNVIVKSDEGTLYPSYFYSYVEREGKEPTAMLEIHFRDKEIDPILFYLFAYLDSNGVKVPVWVNENFNYQIYRTE